MALVNAVKMNKLIFIIFGIYFSLKIIITKNKQKKKIFIEIELEKKASKSSKYYLLEKKRMTICLKFVTLILNSTPRLHFYYISKIQASFLDLFNFFFAIFLK